MMGYGGSNPGKPLMIVTLAPEVSLMMVPASQVTAVGYALAFVGLLMSSGAVAFFFKTASSVKGTERVAGENKHKLDDALPRIGQLTLDLNDADTVAKDAQARVARLEPQVSALQTDFARQQTVIDEIRRQMGKLDRVDEITASVKIMEDIVKTSLVPRAELDRQFLADDRRMGRFEGDLRDLTHKLLPTPKE